MSSKSSAPPDCGSIDVGDHQALVYWSRHWGITPNQLRRAIRQVGTGVAELGTYLGKPAGTRMEVRRVSSR
ncbi:MAG TPA: DUF3606 domain-containing protein [Pirellulaceae bacterium]|nr:DUF3606 domain-containing protein [Pirellulaceae bacterium]